MDPFVVQKNGKTYNYRLGQLLDQIEIRAYFKKLGYQTGKLWFGSRHELGILSKNNQKFFLKLATTEGQSLVLENEIVWNQQVGKLLNQEDVFCVPHVSETGKFQDKFIWEIVDYWEGEMLSAFPESRDTNKLKINITLIIRIIRVIENLTITDLPLDLLDTSETPQERFLNKTKSWFEGIPQVVREKYQITKLLDIVEAGSSSLSIRPRHGDFTPWHMYLLSNDKIGLFDGERAMAKGVENYDLCYLVQRVFSVLGDPELAKEILSEYCRGSAHRQIPTEKIQPVLAARAIGGFLDESLTPHPGYKLYEDFMKWVLHL